MLHKVDEERLPVVLERRRAGIGLDLQLLAVLRLAIDEVLPRHHRVAGDVGSDAAALAEGDILVEDGVVERPRAVRLADVADHRVVAVEALVVPGKLRQRRRQHLLSAVRERGPEGTHRVIVRLRERLRVLPARDGPRMLPEVEEVLPLLRRRQNAIDNADVHHAARIHTGLRISGHGDFNHARAVVVGVPLHTVIDLEALQALDGRRVLHRFQDAKADLNSIWRLAKFGKVRNSGGNRLAAPCRHFKCPRLQRERTGNRYGRHDKCLQFHDWIISNLAPCCLERTKILKFAIRSLHPMG